MPKLDAELRRHLPPPPNRLKDIGGGKSSGNPRGAALTLFGCGVFTLACASLPYWVMQTIRPLSSREEGLNAAQNRRGPYLNTGSRDVGKDPRFDHKTGTYDYKNHGGETLSGSRFNGLLSPFSYGREKNREKMINNKDGEKDKK
mmetsp:Transcript_43727/g.64201  ORF Transcript_43727/g.64201 Transcript_43727/m.64201 type:complete len:145 (+) Transcript_43727:96-530(+)|eukprot:CAMPEP_0195520040 /NCGR_PEP_ID=MMETSP0794_2-20130614/15980_1 /TAXON_ID=515487 /ORGANISM="Stephanopyxis turris, Strain CCMP 815" /LENGTH=144 /DNA_ID=CAMNT_0040649309 /DNA_START=96 /DNA_END=530 /DNA_ORIENTATION=-